MMPATLRSSSIWTKSSSCTPPGVWVHSTGVQPLRASAVSITWANAGKIGLVSSGVTRPTRPALLRRSRLGRSYPKTSSEVRTACRVASATPGLPFRTRLTVASLTSACWAMSDNRAFMTGTSARGSVSWSQCGPHPHVDLGLVRHQGHRPCPVLQPRTVDTTGLLHSRQVSRGNRQRSMGPPGTVDQGRLLRRLPQENQRVLVRVNPPQTPVPQSDAGPACRDQALVHPEQPCVPTALVP